MPHSIWYPPSTTHLPFNYPDSTQVCKLCIPSPTLHTQQHHKRSLPLTLTLSFTSNMSQVRPKLLIITNFNHDFLVLSFPSVRNQALQFVHNSAGVLPHS